MSAPEPNFPRDPHSARHLEAMLRVTRAIGTISDLQTLVAEIIRQSSAAFDADRATLFVYDAEPGELIAWFAMGIDDSPRQLRLRPDQGIAGQVFTTGRGLMINDTLEHDGFDRATADSTGYLPRSILAAPVTHQPGRIDGVLQVLASKPRLFQPADQLLAEAIATQVSVSLDNARLHDAARKQFESFVRAFSTALDARDPITARHSANVANFAMGIAGELGVSADEQEFLRIAGLLHDVGKIGTPEAILTKMGKLSEDEYEVMKQHASHSRTILKAIAFTEAYEAIPQIAPAHHEKLDGSGYPDGLTEDELPLLARILCVADICDALTQDRHYRPAMPLKQAMGIIDRMTPHQLDANCVAALQRFLGVETSSPQCDGSIKR